MSQQIWSITILRFHLSNYCFEWNSCVYQIHSVTFITLYLEDFRLNLYLLITVDESSASQPEHVGVVCDGCEHGIFGTRFKCIVCPDYDLCMKCERKGVHNEHEMLRICTPRTRPGLPFFFPSPFSHYPAGCPPPPHHPPGCPPPPHHPPGFGPWRRGHFRGRGRCGGPRGRCGKATDAKCDQHRETTSDSQEVPVGPPFLHAMGEAIANIFGPMGVEVHTYADNEKGKILTGICVMYSEWFINFPFYLFSQVDSIFI